MQKQFGYAAKTMGSDLELLEIQPPQLKDREVRVSVTHCGLCHTDINAIDDYYGITDFPFFPGHEIVGYVSDVGPSVTGLKEGERVGIGWQGRSCKKCEWCQREEEQFCLDIVADGTWLPYGGFSQSVVVDDRFAHRLPDAMSSAVASVMMCAGITVYSPLRKYADRPKKRIGVIGIGGLGHLAIQFAHTLGYDVTAISSSPSKEKEALSFGADRFVDMSDRTKLREEEYGFDLLLCTADGQFKWEPLLETLKKKGTLVLVGFPRLMLNTTDLVAHELTIVGSFLGNRAIMSEMLSFADDHGIDPKIELMPMAQVNTAIKKLRENKAHYRIVLEQGPE